MIETDIYAAEKGQGYFFGRFYFLNGRYELSEQYLVYDSNSFIADVGGFLGLLLGHSILSLFQFFSENIRRFRRPKMTRVGDMA